MNQTKAPLALTWAFSLADTRRGRAKDVKMVGGRGEKGGPLGQAEGGGGVALGSWLSWA